MKKIRYIFVLMLAWQVAYAQNKAPCYAGVYVTKEDFINNRLSHKINVDSGGNKFVYPIPADWVLTIKIVTPENVYTFKQGTIYGYFACGKVYRYSPGGELYAPEDFYKVEEDRHLVIYTASLNGGTEYYYSLDLSKPIHRLNMKNIEQDFATYPQFIEAVKKLKKDGMEGEFGKRDEKGEFVINNIYDETITK